MYWHFNYKRVLRVYQCVYSAGWFMGQVSGSCISAKPTPRLFGRQPRLGLAKDTITTDSGLNLAG